MTIQLGGVISPASISGAVNNWAPTGGVAANLIRVTTTAVATITGFTGGIAGRVVTLYNTGAYAITLSHDDSGSTAANRLYCPGAFVVLPGYTVQLTYDTTYSRWIVSSMGISAYWGTFSATTDFPNASAGTIQTSRLVVGDTAYSGGLYVCTTATAGSAVWKQVLVDTIGFANLTNSAMTQIADPPSASTGNVVVDATPKPIYYMAPAGNQTFDPTAVTVSATFLVLKTTNSTNKITAKANGATVAGWLIFQAGATNTDFDLPGSATNDKLANHAWSFTCDYPNKICWISPAV